MTHLYFAYGSNMDAAQMRERCPSSRLLGTAIVRDYRLAFTIYSQRRACGCADIIAEPGSCVYGLLYELTEDDLNRLDRFEGTPRHYRRISVRVECRGGMSSAETYEVVEKNTGLMPSAEYLKLIADAARLHRFPEEYQRMLSDYGPTPP